MRKFLCFITLLGVLLCMLPSCSCAGGGDGEVAVFYYTYSDTYISSVRSELDRLFASRGIRYNNYDANGLQTTQTEQIDTAIAKGASMLIVNIVDTGSDDAAKNIISKAKNAGLVAGFHHTAIDTDAAIVASFIGNGAALDQPGDLQILV